MLERGGDEGVVRTKEGDAIQGRALKLLAVATLCI
jgi:hypothetical protein